MSKEVFEQLLGKLAEVSEEIQALPESSANGQLIDAAMHATNCAEHLKRYFAKTGAKQ